ncbi:MAG TPA: bacillithiol biosynthesis cysteine-adding enzyme BshC, partial [Cryomorphaceae bacterium]|nr:bacillithiol biosynthesis cysteine-adding enzyme BshC [Cryomorphaceae bacterium]
RDVLGAGYRSEELLKLFRRAYVESETMADATRLFVHSLFGNLGVVALDGDDPDLKRAAVPLFRKELMENGASKAMRATGEALGEHYSLQVHPRDINLFYLDQELRERFVKEGEDRYGVVNTRLRFTEEELLAELENDPTKFSPNVALRPVYQEHILPNLAYIGGGGELAYWFQLKGVFETYQVPYPIVMLRNSVAFTTPEIERGMESLEVEVRDLLCTEDRALEDALIRKNAAKTLNLDAEWEELEALFGRIKSRMEGVDKLLGRSSDSGLARVERIVRNLEKKMLRAEKKKQEVLIYRLSKIMDVLFPGGGLQERHYGLPLPYLAYGKDWLEGFLEHTDPFGGKFTILRPDSEA